jgi:hypothetical protein
VLSFRRAGLWFYIANVLFVGAICTPAPTVGEQKVKKETSAFVPDCPPRTKTREELALEDAIEEAYRSCFREYNVGGERLVLRIPFGENGERSEKGVFEQEIFGGGKAEPTEIWEEIDVLLALPDFQDYLDVLLQAGAKAITFSLESGSWTVSTEPLDVDRLMSGPYPGTYADVRVLKREAGVDGLDIYNYLYCVGSVGMDCSGFVYYVQKCIARSLAYNLDRIVGRSLRVPAGAVSELMGLWYFNPANGHAESVEDSVSSLRPGDILLFRGRKGEFRHSAVIQSIDLSKGVIRYVHCTDWTTQPGRGVHESFFFFDPAHPDASLRDRSIRWTQAVCPAFVGEPGLKYWKNDGDRYRTQWPTGTSLVVRLEPIVRLVEAVQPAFYSERSGYDENLLN